MASRRGPDNSVRIAISGTLGGNNWAVVHWVQLTTSSSISQSDLDTWLGSLYSAWRTRFLPHMGTGVSVTQAKAVCFTPGGGELISTNSTSASGALSAGTTTPSSEAAVLSWLSGVYWRGGKPRTYLPIGSSVPLNTDNHTLTSTYVTNYKTDAGNFRTDTNALTQGTITGTTLGFVSFRTGNAERGTPLFFSITGANVHPRVGTQRRRLGKWQN